MKHTIKLTRNQSAIIDDIDVELLDFNWYCTKGGYACRDNRKKGERKVIYMHRLILSRKIGRSLNSSEVSDHINRNTLDNRRNNLRIATLSQSMHNTGSKGGTSIFKGIYYYKERKLWIAKIMCNLVIKHIGSFRSEINAARAYDYWAIKLHQEFACLNFPNQQDETIAWWNKRKQLPHRNNTSGYRGVYRNGNKWAARITRNGIRTFLGAFYTKEDASIAYEIASKQSD